MGSSISSQPACGGDKKSGKGLQYHIEVTGVDHDYEKGQHFAFYDLTDMEQQFALEKKVKPNTIRDPRYTTVYSWDWKEQHENRNVWLCVPGEKGDIKLPLFNDVSAYKLEKEVTDYKLESIVPMTLMPVLSELKKDKDETSVAPLRQGYLYIAYQGKIWREIKISCTEDGEPVFRDVDLFSYKDKKLNSFKAGEDKRVATGAALKDIWIPVKNNKKNISVYLAFSEVQWSVERLLHFEKDESNIIERMALFNPKSCKVTTTELPFEMRAREPHHELKLADPTAFSQDLSGKTLLETLNTERDMREEYKKYDDFTRDLSRQYEYRAKATALSEDLQKIMKKVKSENKDKEEQNETSGLQSKDVEYVKKIIEEDKKKESEIINASYDIDKYWTADKVKDYLDDAKKRYIRYHLVDDPIFNLRHHNAILLNAQQTLEYIQTDASLQRDFKSAQLLQMFIMPRKFGDTDNPLHSNASDLDIRPHSIYHKTMRTFMRSIIRSDILFLQQKVFAILESKEFTYALRDIVSLNDAHRACGAYAMVNTCRNALQLQPCEQDLLLLEADREKLRNSDLFIKLNKLFLPDSDSLLNETLFGDKAEGEKLYKYVATTSSYDEYFMREEGEKVNNGSGIASMVHLKRLSQQDLKPNEDAMEQPEGYALLSEINKTTVSEGDKVGHARRIMDKLNGMFGSYFDAAIKAKQLYSVGLESLTSDLKLIRNSIETQQVQGFYGKVSALTKLSGSTISEGWSFKSTSAVNPDTEMLVLAVRGTTDKGILAEFNNISVSTKGAKVFTEAFKNLRGGLDIRDVFYGDWINKQGEIVGSTNKQRIGNQEPLLKVHEAEVALINPNKSPEAAKLAPHIEQRAKDFQEFSHTHAKDLSRAENMHQFNAASAYKKAAVPAVFLYFELWNLHSALGSIIKKRKLGYESSYLDLANIISALGDTAVALTQVYKTLSQKSFTSIWKVEAANTHIGKALSKMTGLDLKTSAVTENAGQRVSPQTMVNSVDDAVESSVTRRAGQAVAGSVDDIAEGALARGAGQAAVTGSEGIAARMGLAVCGEITLLSIAGAGFGVLTGLITIYNGWQLLCKGNILAGLATIVAGLIIAISSVFLLFISSTPLLGIPILGWISFALVTIFCVVSAFLMDSPLETWIEQSVFSNSLWQSDDYDFLRNDPDVAYKQLLNILLSVKLINGPVNPLVTSLSQGKLSDDQALQLSKKLRIKAEALGATHFVRLQTNALSFFGLSAKDIKINKKFQGVDVSTTILTYGSTSTVKSKPYNATPFTTFDLPDGVVFLFKLAPVKKPYKDLGVGTAFYSKQIEALAQIEVGDMIFPQPSLDAYKQTQQYLKDNKINKIEAKFSDGQTHGVVETLFSAPSVPKNPFWADSRDEG